MEPEVLNLPVIRREAALSARSADSRLIDIVWTTGAVVRRARWEGWDDLVEYDEELVVSPNAIRMDRLNSGAAPFLDSHSGWRLADVLGSVVEGTAKIEGGEGRAQVRLTTAEDAAPAVQRIMDGSVRSVSVGYRVWKYEITKKDGERELWRAVDWEPYEISAVAMPADPGAKIRGAEGAPAALEPCVLVRTHPTPARSAANRKRTAMEATTETTAAPDPAAPAAAEAAPQPETRAPADERAIREAARRESAEIYSLCERHNLGGAFARGLVERGASVAAAREAILERLAERDGTGGRTSEPSVPAQARGNGDAAFAEAMGNAIMHRADPGRNALAPDAREFRAMSLLELGRRFLERRGVSTGGMSKLELAREALNGRAAVGYHTTADFPFILANVANKSLRAGYDGTPRTFTAWARRATITDFKPVQRTQLGGAPNLDLVPESGEFSYGTMGEGREIYALATYGKIIAVNRQALINDDLDAFTRVPTAFGASAADLESDLVYSILISNPLMGEGVALFAAGHSNVGTAAAITEASLAEAYRLFGNQRGLEGRQISIMPRFIITPPGVRSVEARKNVTATTPASVAGVNAFAGRLEPIEEPRLIPAAGADPWFLAADPARIDTVEYAYLEGQEGLFTETRVGFEVDGVEIKARADFATKAIDWRGLMRNVGV